MKRTGKTVQTLRTRKSSAAPLAGALLRMKDLGLPEMPEFPLPDPPSSKLVTEGYRTLREIGALDKARQAHARR